MPTETRSRRLAAILAIDMVGYSRLIEIDEVGTLRRQRSIQTGLIDPRVSEYGGRIVKTTGDGALIEFPSAVNAVACAAAVQREMADREADTPKDRRIAYRIGINVGDIVVDDHDDTFGDGVNVASRLEGLAEPGGIRISQAVFNSVRGKLDLGFADLGPQQVKNRTEPVQTFKVLLEPADAGRLVRLRRRLPPMRSAALAIVVLVALVGAGFYARDLLVSPAVAAPPQLLVLPVSAADADSRPVAQAATENMISSFARLKGLETAPRAVSMEFEGIALEPGDEPEGRVLHYVLDGQAERLDGGIKVTARLRDFRAGSGKVVWEQSETGEAGELFDILATLKLGASAAMKVTLDQTERAILEARPTGNIEAYLAYAEAERSLDFPKLTAALPLFERAIELDPGFLAARVGYAEANFQIWTHSYNTIRFSPDAFDVMQDTVSLILDEDPQNPEAIGLRIRALIEQGKPEQALSEARAAVFLHQHDFDNPWLKFILGVCLLYTGDYDAAKEQFRVYEELSPRLNSIEKRTLAQNYLLMGEAETAIALLDSVPPEEANELRHFYLLAQAKAQMGEIDAAKLNANKVLKAIPWISISWYKPFFENFTDAKIPEKWFSWLRRAGYPETPYDIAQKREGDRLLHDDLMDLFSDRYVEVHDKGPFGLPYEEDRRSDGTIKIKYAWMDGVIFSGTWSIKGDQFCHKIDANYMGREACNNVYIDRDNSTESEKFVTNLWNNGAVDSVFKRGEQ